MVTQQNPVRVFVGHAWSVDADYLRVFEFFESARRFFYANSSDPERRPVGGREAEREELRRQIAPAEIVVLCTGHHLATPDTIEFEALFAKSAGKPVLLLPAFGALVTIPPALTGVVDEAVEWNERALRDAICRLARGEAVARWDTIDFKLD
jgi:sugar/nucleoside kinase (ribokinase family)